MLSTSTRLRLQEMLKRLAQGHKVSLQERIFINKYAARDQNVSTWVKRALRMQQNHEILTPIDTLLDGLDLFPAEPFDTYNPDAEDLGDWFSGAPIWLRRS